MTIRGLLWIAALFVIAVGLALAGRFEQGHVIFIYPPYRVDTSFHALVAAIVVLFVVLYVLIRVVRGVLKMPSRVSGFRARSRSAKAQAALRDALSDLYSGRFSRAEKAAQTAAMVPENQDSAALIGALAAHRMRQTTRRDHWLAQMRSAQWQDARLMTLAEMHVDAREPEAALQALSALEAQGAKRLRAQQIGLRAHKELNNWNEVLKTVKTLEKREAIHPAAAAQLQRQAGEALLREHRHDAETLYECWQTLPDSTRLAPRVADLAARLLLRLEHPGDARRVVEAALEKEWDARLVQRYGECGKGDPLPLIQRAEAWQLAHPNDADLNFALGALCIEQRLWGKAQSFLEAALKLAEHAGLKARIHRALAQMHDALGNMDDAHRHYRESALAVTQG